MRWGSGCVSFRAGTGPLGKSPGPTCRRRFRGQPEGCIGFSIGRLQESTARPSILREAGEGGQLPSRDQPVGTGPFAGELDLLVDRTWARRTMAERAGAITFAKSDVGLDEETRTWAGWHHHVALCLLAGAFLLSLQQAWGEKGDEAAGLPGGAGDAASSDLKSCCAQGYAGQ